MERPDSTVDTRLRQAVVTLAVWLAATLLVGRVLRGGGEVPSVAKLIAELSQGIAWNVVLGLAVLALASRRFGWTDLGFRRPDLGQALRLMWFPLLLLLPVFALALAIGLPPARAVACLALNTLFVALSEEWMFRGILFRALAARHPVWPSVLLTSFVFGSVHVLNGFTYGDLAQSGTQAVAAMMTGLLLGALLIRTDSIWVPEFFHMVWNLGLLLVTFEAAQQPPEMGPLRPEAYVVPLAIVTPNLFYAVFLLRRVRKPSA
jgi:membrane protease YdiL (CAAX protease family)